MITISDEPQKAVAYYRHSAEDKQENSVAIQREYVETFAKKHGIEIIAECIDDGLTGTNAKRQGFQDLLNQWVNNPDVKFDYVLVLDVSRFGRFKNPNEAGSYVFQCCANGRQVIYAKRGFPQKGQELTYHIVEAVERIQATAFITELSEKVWYGQAKITEQGYSAGGSAPYGLKRILLDEQKRYQQDLKHGQGKFLSNQRVTFAPGDKKEQRIVTNIFEMYTEHGFMTSEIAAYLNKNKVRSPSGNMCWSSSSVLNVIHNPKYAGATVFNRSSHKIYTDHSTTNSKAEWIVQYGAFQGIIDKTTFEKAQRIASLRATVNNKVTVIDQQVTTDLEDVASFMRGWVKWLLDNCIVIRQSQQPEQVHMWVRTRKPFMNSDWQAKTYDLRDTRTKYTETTHGLISDMNRRLSTLKTL